MSTSIAAEAPSPARVWAWRGWLFAAVSLGSAVLLYTQLSRISSVFTYRLLRLAPGSHLAAAVEFFVFEAPKVLMLLTGVVFGVGILRSWFTPGRARELLAGRREAAGNVLAALLGVVTPFCSCSAVPLFIGFVTAGVPLGVTFSFLISAPMVNEVALVLLFGLFGWKVAALYLGTGLAHRHRRRLDDRTAEARALRVEPWVWQDPGRRPAERRTAPRLARQDRDSGRGTHAVARHRGQGLALRGRGHRGRRRASTATSPRTSWPRSWARAPGGRCRSPC